MLLAHSAYLLRFPLFRIFERLSRALTPRRLQFCETQESA